MLHLGPPPVVRPPVVSPVVQPPVVSPVVRPAVTAPVFRSAVTSVARDYFKVAEPGMRIVGAHSGRFFALMAGAVVLVAGLALPSGLAVQSALADVPVLVDAGVSPSVRAATVRSSPVEVPAAEALQVHVQSPSSLLAGGSRQFRIAVVDLRAGDASEGNAHFIRVEVELQSPLASAGIIAVAPSQVVASARSLDYTEFRLELAHGVACETDLGEMLVRVVGAGGARGETLIALPPVDCRPDLRAPSVFDGSRK